MAELRTVMVGEEPPQGVGHVLVRYALDGWYSARGSVQGSAGEAVSWMPPRFGSLGEALCDACIWADAHGVPVVYFERGPPLADARRRDG